MKKSIPEKHIKRLSELGCYLRELRMSENITQKEVSHDVALHHNSISNAENGYNITLVALFTLCDYYNVPIDQIFIDIE
ncbi:MAG: helix-turn-helix transcriptional regulator [Prolixibacteraceae bacterium]|nr:helix-turn-helix transcriptional regulator [Prolixibacteraceae bacterium]